MLPQYTTVELIANIKRRCTVPTSQLTFTNQDFTNFANDQCQGIVVPLLMSTREEFFVEPVDIPLPATKMLEFPDDTVASKVRSVCYLKQEVPLVLVNLPRIDLDVVSGAGFNNVTTLAGFFVQGNKMVIYQNNAVPVGTIIRIYFYKRTLHLAAPQTYGRVTAVDPNTNTVRLSYVPITSWTVGTVLNSINSLSPFNTTLASTEITGISSPDITLTSVEGISVGDYLCDEGYTAIPQIPLEAHAYLAQITAQICLESLGDREGAQVAARKAEELKTGILTMTSQRIDGSVKKVMHPNGGVRMGAGLGRWGRGRNWGW